MDNSINSNINQEQKSNTAESACFKRICNKAGFLTFISCIIFFVFSYVLLWAFRALLNILPPLTSSVDTLPNSICNGVISLFAIGLAGIYLGNISKIKDFLPINKTGKRTLLYLIVIGFSVCMLSNYLTSLFLSNAYDLGINLYHTSASQQHDSLIEIVFYILSVAVVPAISEEILFRGLLFSVLRKHSDGFAILISSLIFGLYHGNFVQIPFAFIVGLILSLTVVYTNSIIPAIIIHFSNNLFSVICDILSKNAVAWGIDITTLGLLVNLIVAAFAIASVFCAKKLSEKDRTFLSLNGYSGNLSSKETRKIFFTSPGMMAALVFLIIQTIVNHIF